MAEAWAEGSRAPDAGPGGEIWAPVIARAIMDTGLSDGAFRTLCVMIELDRPRRSGGVWHSSRQLARLRGFKSRSAVVRQLAELQAAGYISREFDHEDDAPGRFIRFAFRAALGRPPKATPPDAFGGQPTDVHQMDGGQAPSKSGASAAENGRGRPDPRAQSTAKSGASASDKRRLPYSERKNTNGDGDGRAEGGLKPARPVAGERSKKDPRDLRGFKPSDVLGMAPDDARRFLLTAEEMEAARQLVIEAAHPGFAKMARRDVANHFAAEIVLGLRPSVHAADKPSKSRAIGDSGGKGKMLPIEHRKEPPPPQVPTGEAGGVVESHP